MFHPKKWRRRKSSRKKKNVERSDQVHEVLSSQGRPSYAYGNGMCGRDGKLLRVNGMAGMDVDQRDDQNRHLVYGQRKGGL